MKRAFFAATILPLLSPFALAQEYMWDALRPVSDAAKDADPTIKIAVFLLSLAVFAVSILAYSKSRSKRILLVSFAFFLFTLKWLVKVIDIFYSPGSFLSDSSENVFELGILLSLLFALFYRKSWSRFFERDKN